MSPLVFLWVHLKSHGREQSFCVRGNESKVKQGTHNLDQPFGEFVLYKPPYRPLQKSVIINIFPTYLTTESHKSSLIQYIIVKTCLSQCYCLLFLIRFQEWILVIMLRAITDFYSSLSVSSEHSNLLSNELFCRVVLLMYCVSVLANWLPLLNGSSCVIKKNIEVISCGVVCGHTWKLQSFASHFFPGLWDKNKHGFHFVLFCSTSTIS